MFDDASTEFQKNIRDYELAISTLISVWDVNKGKPTGRLEVWGDFESLTIKILLQSVSALKLYKGNNFIFYNGNETFACDFTSINIIARSVLEAYLHAYWIFIDVKDESEREYRVICWRMSAMNFRLQFQPVTREGYDAMEFEKENLKTLTRELHQNTFFNGLSVKQQTKINKMVTKGDNIRPGWKELIHASGLSEDMKDAYSYMCDHSHSGRLSSLQLYNAQGDIDQQRVLCRVPLNVILMCMCQLIYAYSDIYELSNRYLLSHENAMEVIKKWYEIGKNRWR